MQSDTDLIPVEEAAAELGIRPARLIGFIARNGLADPVGDFNFVYRSTRTTLRERLRAADHATGVQP